MSTGPLSKELFNAAQKLMPGGVSSPVRSFSSVGGDPFFVEKAKGPYIFDADGNRYIDFVMSYGPLILGHAHEDVLGKVEKVMARGLSFGAPNGMEVELAKLVTDRMPSLEMVRFVNSGTEATMSAIRLARAYTDRPYVIKFNGNYHGHGDAFLVEAGSGVAQHGIPGSPGIPSSTTQHTLSLPYNDINAIEQVFAAHEKEIAAIIIEPVCGNMGVIVPPKEYLQKIRTLCDEHGAVLIFDEVMTGFRVHRSGAQGHFDVMPDLTCLGKIIGGGMPVGAYGGRKDIMKHVAPVGPVYQAGTLSGNPVCMAAGIKTLKEINAPEFYQTLDYRTQFLADELTKSCEEKNIDVVVQRLGSMMTLFFGKGPIQTFEDVQNTDHKMFSKYFHAMLDQGVFIPPSPFEAWFLSIAHDEEVLQMALKAHEEALESL